MSVWPTLQSAFIRLKCTAVARTSLRNVDACWPCSTSGKGMASIASSKKRGLFKISSLVSPSGCSQTLNSFSELEFLRRIRGSIPSFCTFFIFRASVPDGIMRIRESTPCFKKKNQIPPILKNQSRFQKPERLPVNATKSWSYILRTTSKSPKGVGGENNALISFVICWKTIRSYYVIVCK